MGAPSKKLRKKLFDIYAKNLSTAIPGMADTFRCPVCLKDFDRSDLDADQTLTFGHIIPEATRGKIGVLKCGSCNHKIGTTYDSHIAEEKIFSEWIAGVEGSERFVYVDGVPTYTTWEKSRIFDIKPVDAKEPSYIKRFKELDLQLSRTGTAQLKIKINEKHSPKKRDISLIHSAFLMMFFCFGYEYILSQAADKVRQIIQGGESPWDINNMIFNMESRPPFPIPAAGVLKSPKEISSFIIVMPSTIGTISARLVSFPGFGFNGDRAYQRLIEMKVARKFPLDVKADMVYGGLEEFGYLHSIWNNASGNQTAILS